MMKELLLVCILALTTPVCSGCYKVLTPAQLAERGTHRVPNVSREKATDACATALATLGYQVTAKEPESGMVKTAPKTIMVSAIDNGSTANATEDGVAWSISIEASGAGVVFHATPRGFRNGSEMHQDGMWTEEVMDAKFRDLWHEIDSTLNSAQPAK